MATFGTYAAVLQADHPIMKNYRQSGKVVGRHALG
jgi:hypothetical protein